MQRKNGKAREFCQSGKGGNHVVPICFYLIFNELSTKYSVLSKWMLYHILLNEFQVMNNVLCFITTHVCG